LSSIAIETTRSSRFGRHHRRGKRPSAEPAREPSLRPS
jgi:hypothetical protein